MKRECGVLLAISSLPSSYGIGDFGNEAYRFVDFLVASGQNLWQILPLCPVEYGNSPYQSPSTFAGNFLYLDLEELVRENYLTEDDVNILNQEVLAVNYGDVKYKKEFLLRKAAQAFFDFAKEQEAYDKFQKENLFWLEDYALFLYLNQKFNYTIWNKWDKKYKFRMKKYLDEIKQEKDFLEVYKYESFVQYYFHKQWFKLKKYANDRGIKIIGDLPIYVATHSADTWKNPKLFALDKHLKIKAVAGCPPDYFSKEGQLWGNILYDWKAMREQNYSWWIDRVKHSFKLYDTIRLDHFRGFASYWSVRYGDKNAVNGKWEIGPRYNFFQVLERRIKNLDIVAEDLGTLTPDVFKLLDQTEYPNMKVLQFGLTEWDNMYNPKNYSENCVAYTGTHDNMTMVEWYETLNKNDKNICDENLKNFLKDYNTNIWDPIQWRAIEALYASKARKVIVPLQDILGLGAEGRMNTPSTVGENWKWRVFKNYKHEDLENKLKFLSKKYNRFNEGVENGI